MAGFICSCTHRCSDKKPFQLFHECGISGKKEAELAKYLNHHGVVSLLNQISRLTVFFVTLK